MTTRSRTRRGPARRIEEVNEHTLPEDTLPLIERYEAVMGERDRFLWKWAHHLFPTFTLSCVDPARADETRDAKLLGLIYVSVLDDLAEMQADLATFQEAAKVPFAHRTVDRDRAGVDREVLDFAVDVWERFAPTLADGPRAAEFENLVEFDLEQIINSMRYSSLANRDLEFVNGAELRTYDAHNMMLYGFADVDLLYSPTFDRAETSTLRRVVGHAQQMARIGNWVTTWERELAEGDFTSGVVVYALEHDIVSVDELESIRAAPEPAAVEDVVESVREQAVEDVFLGRWEEELAAARGYEDRVESVDVAGYLDGVETVMEYHLASRGLK